MKFFLVLVLVALALPSGAEKTSTSASTRIEQATAAMEKNDLDKVIELLNPYTDQLSQPGYLMLANAYSQKKDFVNEVRILGLLVAKDEANYKWQVLLAQAYLKQGKATSDPTRSRDLINTGIQKLRTAMNLNPKYKPTFDLLVQTLLWQKANYEAREVLSDGLAKFGRRPEIVKELCRLNSMDGFLVQAIEFCEASIELSPGFADSYVYLVQSLHDQGEDQKAEKEAVAAARKFPKNEFVLWAAGKFFEGRKNLSVAARYYEQATLAKPDSARAQFGAATTQLEMANYDKALEFFKKACKLDPLMSQETFLNAASRLRQKGLSKLAEKYNSSAYSCK